MGTAEFCELSRTRCRSILHLTHEFIVRVRLESLITVVDNSGLVTAQASTGLLL